MTNNLDIEVKRNKEELVEDLMEYRNQKVEADTDFPANYKARVYGTGNPAEDAFYESFADSTMKMQIKPKTGFNSLEDVAKAVDETKDAETNLRAKVDGVEHHAPIVQRGMNALEEAGFDVYAEIGGTYEGESIAETVELAESKGANLEVWATEDPVTDHPDSHYVTATYDPSEQVLEPANQVCAPAHAEEGEVEELDRLMEDALDEIGLLRYPAFSYFLSNFSIHRKPSL
jgi:hypothetical protein